MSSQPETAAYKAAPPGAAANEGRTRADPMQRLDFQDALDRFGADLGRWPAPERALAAAMLREDPSLGELVAEARRLKALIASTAPVRAPAGLADRIVSLAAASAPPLPRVASPPTADAQPRERLRAAEPQKVRRPGER